MIANTFWAIHSAPATKLSSCPLEGLFFFFLSLLFSQSISSHILCSVFYFKCLGLIFLHIQEIFSDRHFAHFGEGRWVVSGECQDVLGLHPALTQTGYLRWGQSLHCCEAEFPYKMGHSDKFTVFSCRYK